MQEIGSEFWLTDEADHLRINTKVPNGYFLSGRTVIDAILQQVMENTDVKNAYLPAYCCESMVLPFLTRGIAVDFYDVVHDGKSLNFLIDSNHSVSILYISNYFGYQSLIDENLLSCFRQKGSIIIYDKTHSLFLDNEKVEEYSDYSFASIRKWCNVVGGAYIFKSPHPINIELKDCPYVSLKLKAMKYKGKYINGDTSISKDDFLNLFKEFNEFLKRDYHMYKMDITSYSLWENIDKESIKSKRRDNAYFIHEALKNDDRFHYMFDLNEEDIPLFVPILFKSKEERDRVRDVLINQQIYCPIHWPKCSYVKQDMTANGLFEKELSIVCDQRYDKSDMQRLIGIIKNSR